MELSRIENWKQFEKFCADLLQAEGFSVVSEPFVDTDGVDFVALESYRSHSTDRSIEIQWRVQCKHYAKSGNRLKREEAEKIVYNYEANRSVGEGLFVIISSDYSQGALKVFENYIKRKKDARISIWNERQLLVRLERHPEIARRYGLTVPLSNYEEELSKLRDLGPIRVLVISDQSAFAHNLVRGLGVAGLEVIFVPFWNYQVSSSFLTLRGAVEIQHIDLVVFFLGDSFGYPMPNGLTSFVKRLYEDKTPILFFPFFAWSVNRGRYLDLEEIIPVKLVNPKKITQSEMEKMYMLGPSRLGDFRFLLAFDSFAEDQYVEFSPEKIHDNFSKGITKKFGISHSFEYLVEKVGSKIICRDNAGNPLVVVNNKGLAKVGYLNSCCHSCLTLTPVSSPLEVSQEFSILLRNVLEWLVSGNES